ncbi:uncharacterized protein BXZ73DRAFT_59234, partial [Epithele typhae]|uniref:uncharacterized protein n=1 Tax=Epithele typhae TaxID=378194 RepID=UPI0020082EEC
GVPGYRVARVRAVFSLPPELQALRDTPTDPDAHLAYIELYTSFKPRPEEPSGLYAVSKAYTRGIRRAAIIPVTDIFRSCHLLPRCRERVNRAWSSTTVLEECEEWFLNTYIDHHMYLFVE